MGNSGFPCLKGAVDMKKVIIVILLILVVLGFYYKDRIVQILDENGIHIVDIKLFDFKNSKYQFQLNDEKFKLGGDNSSSKHALSGDDKLIQAVIQSDGEAVEKILASDENGEFIRLFKQLRPEKIYSLLDVAKLNCNTSPACKNHERQPETYLQQCANQTLEMVNSELKKYPSCKKDIDEFYAVTFLCQLYQNQSVCVQDDPIESIEDRTKRLTARGQNSVDCLMRHMDDFNAKNKCIINAPRYTQSQYDEQVKKYCQQAISCNAFTKESDCIDKYNQLFKDDKQKGKDCTNVHITALYQEFQMLNFLFDKKFGFNHWGEPYDSCMLVKDYEQMLHVEEIFAKAKTIQDYSSMSMAELQKPETEVRLTWRRIPVYFPPRVMEYNQMISEALGSYNYYSACRIGQLSPK